MTVARNEKRDWLCVEGPPEKAAKSVDEGILKLPVAGGVPVELKKRPCVAAVGSHKLVSRAGVWLLSAHRAGAVGSVNSELFPISSEVRVALLVKSPVLLELRDFSFSTVVLTARLLLDRGTGPSLPGSTALVQLDPRKTARRVSRSFILV